MENNTRDSLKNTQEPIQEEVKDERNIIPKREMTDNMKQALRILYAAIGGAIIAMSATFLSAFIVAGVKDVLTLGTLILTILIGIYLVYWRAYLQR